MIDLTDKIWWFRYGCKREIKWSSIVTHLFSSSARTSTDHTHFVGTDWMNWFKVVVLVFFSFSPKRIYLIGSVWYKMRATSKWHVNELERVHILRCCITWNVHVCVSVIMCVCNVNIVEAKMDLFVRACLTSYCRAADILDHIQYKLFGWVDWESGNNSHWNRCA